MNNAGSNIPDRELEEAYSRGRRWSSSARTCRTRLSWRDRGPLPIMRKQKDGVIINIASIAGRFVSTQPGVGYIAAKHGVVALSHSINMEECRERHSLDPRALTRAKWRRRSSLSVRFPVSDEDKARMLQSEDLRRSHPLHRLPAAARVPQRRPHLLPEPGLQFRSLWTRGSSLARDAFGCFCHQLRWRRSGVLWVRRLR